MAISREHQDHAFYKKLFAGNPKTQKSIKALEGILNSDTLAESFITNLGGLSAVYSNADRNNTLCKMLGESEYGEQAFMNYLQLNGVETQSTFSSTLSNAAVQTEIVNNSSMIRGVMCIPNGLNAVKNSGTFMSGIAASDIALDTILTMPNAMDAVFTSPYNDVRMAYMSEKYILKVYGNKTKTGTLTDIAAKQGGYVFTKETATMSESTSQYATLIMGDYLYLIGGTHPTSSSPSPYVSYKKAALTSPMVFTKSSEVFTFNVYASNIVVLDNIIYVYGTSNPVNQNFNSYIAVGTLSDNSGNLAFRTVIPPNVTNTDFHYGKPVIVGENIMFYGGTVNGESAGKTKIMKASVKNPLLVYDTGKVLPLTGGVQHVITVGNYIYIYSTTNIMRASISNPDSVSIVTDKTLPYNCTGSASAIIGNYIYMYGGAGGFTKIMRAALSSPDDFTIMENSLPVNVNNSSAITVNDKVYIYGSDQSNGITAIISAPLSDM